MVKDYLLNVFTDGILARPLTNLSNIGTTEALCVPSKSLEVDLFCNR